MATTGPHPQADFIAGIHANAADQFLISYLTLTRFPQSNPYALSFALGHCFELSLKTVYWQTKRTLPDTHKLHKLITELGGDLERELDKVLPELTMRNRFEASVEAMKKAPIDQFLRMFFDFVPTGNDDAWLVLYTLYIVADVKFGVDKKQRVLQLMQQNPPKLNAMGLRSIACVRRRFSDAERHRKEIERFIDHYAVRAPVKGVTVARLRRLAEENERGAVLKQGEEPADRAATQDERASERIDRPRSAQDTSVEEATGAVIGAPDAEAASPKSSLVFTVEELRMIKNALSLQLRTDPDLDEDAGP